MEPVISIGPECFVNEQLTVISFKGENFYKACGETVLRYPDGSESACVKRVNHPSLEHEDFMGTTLTIRMGEVY